MPSIHQGREPAGDKLAYISPKVEQTASTDGRPLDVTPTTVAAASKTPRNGRFDFCSLEPSNVRAVCWKRQDEVLEYPLDRDALLFHPETRLLCQLNETAYFLWRNCDGINVAGLAAKLTDTYHVEIDKATDHVMQFVELFSISGFISEEARHVVPS